MKRKRLIEGISDSMTIIYNASASEPTLSKKEVARNLIKTAMFLEIDSMAEEVIELINKMIHKPKNW